MEQRYNNQPVEVKFPTRMEVHSPELDAVKESTRTISNILSDHLQKIASGITSLQALPQLFKELKELVASQFSNLFQTQVEAGIMNRQASIKVLGKKIGFVEKHINKKEEQLDKTNKQISDRFANISKEMTKEHELFLSKLDSHTYTITEQIYPKQIKERFSYDTQPNIDYLVSHTIESGYLRTKCLTDCFLDAKRQAENFLLEREIMYNAIEKHGIISGMTPGQYKLPALVYILKNNETGDIETKFIFPWSGNEGKTLSSEAELEKILIDKMESSTYSSQSKEVFSKNILEIMKTNDIPKNERDRFFKDCKSIQMEEAS